MEVDTDTARPARSDLDLVDMGGVGGTLAGNPPSIAATRATLEHVLTDDVFTRMIDTATYFAVGLQSVIDQHSLPWSLTQLGARAEYRFADPAPATAPSRRPAPTASSRTSSTYTF